MGSPIEDMLLTALRRPLASHWVMDATDHPSALRERWITPNVWLDDERHDRAIYLYRAVSILTYRADFVLELDIHRRLAVECDGHDFHDRTKQQAAYDRSRDRELLAIGIPTIRFTGSEIHHSVERCAQEAYRCLLSLPDQRGLVHTGWEEAVWFYESRPGVEEHW